MRSAFIAFALIFGFICIFDESGHWARIAGHIGGGCWLILSGAFLRDFLASRTSAPTSTALPQGETLPTLPVAKEKRNPHDL
jgi:hypothetical protein